METRKLYYEDPYQKEFDATVVACEAKNGAWRVELDQTAFYPEGGGQPADHGDFCLSDGSKVIVSDTHEQEGTIWHTCDREIPAGTAIRGILDWNRRFDLMQQHSGEHILSGLLCESYDCDNVGFHMNEDTVTIDYNVALTWEQVLDAERRANEAIWADLAMEITWPSPEELKKLNYRSKKELTGKVRIVTFPGSDCCACCGVHVTRTGQVGLIKILSCIKHKDGVRMEIMSGGRAYRYMREVYEQDRQIGQKLSAKPHETLPAVEKLEASENNWKLKTVEWQNKTFAYMAKEQAGKENALLFTEDLNGDAIRHLAELVSEYVPGLIAVFSKADDHANYVLYTKNAASVDVGAFVKEMNGALEGRGGGKNGFAQGGVKADEAAIRAFFASKEL